MQRLEIFRHKLRDTWSLQKLEEAKKDSRDFRGSMTLPTPRFSTSGFQDCDRVNFFHLHCQVCDCYSSPGKKQYITPPLY